MLRFLVALLALAFIVAAGASCAPVDEVAIRPLMPEVRYAGHEEMAALSCPGDEKACGGLQAVYDTRNRVVYLRRGFDPSDPVDAATLLHEFVHHVQVLSGREFECPQAREKEAYAVQRAYLAASGVGDPLKVMGVNELFLLTVTSCQVLP